MLERELSRLYAGEAPYVVIGTDGNAVAEAEVDKRVVLAGSFNPLHRGHKRMLETAARITGRRGLFEISIQNVDKPDLPRDELERRLDAFRDVGDVVVTCAPLFAQKATLLRGCWFVLGYDTAVRLLDDWYYASVTTAERELLAMEGNGTRFVVAGRVDASGSFRGLADLIVPDRLRDMFVELPQSEFREDISSTELRQRRYR
jgi:hypothetical protein